MSFKMYYENYTNSDLQKLEKFFEVLAKTTFQVLNDKNKYEFSVSIIDSIKMQELNNQYRQINEPTDVISFAFNDFEDNIVLEDRITSLGDILICYEVALAQSNEYNHTLDREIGFLFVHGLLHLLGFNHLTKEDEKEMFKLQDEILTIAKVGKEFRING